MGPENERLNRAFADCVYELLDRLSEVFGARLMTNRRSYKPSDR
jgi:hypothetical protein